MAKTRAPVFASLVGACRAPVYRRHTSLIPAGTGTLPRCCKTAPPSTHTTTLIPFIDVPLVKIGTNLIPRQLQSLFFCNVIYSNISKQDNSCPSNSTLPSRQLCLDVKSPGRQQGPTKIKHS